MAGACTDISVLCTAGDARNRDFEVEVPADCVTFFDRNGRNLALDHMRRILGVQVVGAPPDDRER